jgi:1,2-phenylacetyl-CoA epoxidase catalytic subunit
MNKTITLNRDYFEHLLSCLANQKFIHDVNADGLSEGEEKVRQQQAEMQRVIDVAWREGMDMLYKSEKAEEQQA